MYLNPNFKSVYLTETVYGESSRILRVNGNWYFIECEDKYKGWINNFYGFVSPKKNNVRFIVVNPDSKGRYSFKYPFGARTQKELEGSISLDEKLGINGVKDIVNNLVGCPYKWGGKTSLGFDCSGLIQSVLKACGYKIPRDSFEQKEFFNDCVIDLEDSKCGDLHFFGKNDKVSHVAFSLGGSDFIHSQGNVKIESLYKSSKNFNSILLDLYLSTCSIRLKFNK